MTHQHNNPTEPPTGAERKNSNGSGRKSWPACKPSDSRPDTTAAAQPDPADVAATYNPTLGIRLLRYGIGPARMAMEGQAPTLFRLEQVQGREAAVLWVRVQIANLCQYAAPLSPMDAAQAEELALLILAQHGHLRLSEVLLFFARLKGGRYGQFYGAPDPVRVAHALHLYEAERAAAIETARRQEASRQLQAEAERQAGECITYEEYQRRKRLREQAAAAQTETPPNPEAETRRMGK